MIQLDSLELKKSMEEFGNRHCQTAFHEIAKHDGFESTFEWVILSFSCTPLNYSLTLKQTHSLQFLHSRFGYLALLPTCGKISNFLVVDLGLVHLGSHLSVTSYDLSSGATREANERRAGKETAWEVLDLPMTAAWNQRAKNPKSYRSG